MPIVLTGQTPAPGAIDHDAAAFYQLTFEVTPVAEDFLIRVTFDDGAPLLVLDFSTPPISLVFAPGWEGAVDIVGTTVTVTFRPIGGWQAGANYGAGGGALVGRITEVRLSGEPGLLILTPPALDFATAAAELVEDVPVGPGRPYRFAAGAWITASGLLTLQSRVAAAVRTGPGVYVVELELGFGRHVSEYHPRVMPLASLPRLASVAEGPGASSLTVRTFDAAGQPADANVSLVVASRRVTA